MTNTGSNQPQNPQSETAVQNHELRSEAAKAQVEIARIQAETNTGWQTVLTKLADVWEEHDTQKASSENRYTMTLTMSIIIFLAVIVGTLTLLAWQGLVSGDSLLFFLGTLSGSVLMLVAERIKAQR